MHPLMLLQGLIRALLTPAVSPVRSSHRVLSPADWCEPAAPLPPLHLATLLPCHRHEAWRRPFHGHPWFASRVHVSANLGTIEATEASPYFVRLC